MTISLESVDAAAKSRHAERVGDKPGKYWDYNECRWVKSPSPAEDARVPEQAAAAEDADDATVVATSQ
jgi:hypothetical protein